MAHVQALQELTLAQVCAHIGLDEAPADWVESWSASASELRTGCFDFLDAQVLHELCTWLRMGDDARDALAQAAEQLRDAPALLRLLWHLHHRLLAGALADGAPSFPDMPARLGAAGRLFYAIFCLSGIPRARELHAARGIGEAVSIETFDDIEVWMRHWKALRGEWAFHQAGWLMKHLNDQLYRLGRLQFEITDFTLPFHVYRDDAGQICALAADGARFRADGQFHDADRSVDPDAWTARLHENESAIVGHPVDARGAVRRETVTLESARWREIVTPTSDALGVHIQASGPMREDDCRDSLRRALAFVPRHVPEHAVAACTCRSWLLDPQLGDHLPADSNLVRFLRLWRLLPEPGGSDAQTIERVFGSEDADLSSAPRDTSLRRVVLDHIAQGGRWRGHAGYILPDDIERSGE